MTGHPVFFMTGMDLKSTTRLLYPKLVPLSVSITDVLPVDATFFIASAIAEGAMNWPFLMFTGNPVFPAETRRSVCLQRYAGIWTQSTTSATALQSYLQWTSVSRGTVFSDPKNFLTFLKNSRPF